jgi:hypothetical protein
MNAAAANAETGDWHNRQRQTLTTYKPSNPALPSDYNCPKGACATPPPPAPVVPTPSMKEGFNQPATTKMPHAWLLTMAAATALFIALTRLAKRN